MDLQLIKKHIRVDHSFEDELIEDYISWAEAEIKDSVSTEEIRNELFFDDNPHFNRAKVMLVAHYFENRIGYTEKSLTNTPDAILSAVQKLRASYVPLDVMPDDS